MPSMCGPGAPTRSSASGCMYDDTATRALSSRSRVPGCRAAARHQRDGAQQQFRPMGLCMGLNQAKMGSNCRISEVVGEARSGLLERNLGLSGEIDACMACRRSPVRSRLAP
jgi:hypothetical protein